MEKNSHFKNCAGATSYQHINQASKPKPPLQVESKAYSFLCHLLVALRIEPMTLLLAHVREALYH